MEFPPNWEIFPLEDFEIAAPRNPGDLGMELLAQSRQNGRVMDNWRIAIGGSKIISATFNIKNFLIGSENFPDLEVKFQSRPEEVKIRRNMSTGEWMDISDLLRSNDVLVQDESEQDPVTNADLLESLNKITDKNFSSFSIRWAVVASASLKMELHLQSLPATSKFLNSKPMFKRYKLLKNGSFTKVTFLYSSV